ncbi:prepilin-type N-terminal cleavage/methylation domain-containing protein [Synechococcus sp. PCC 7502]|uniref:prepilin-type N-terminal cleavage/methylation domain-containing protein n=1 Tax=Synechococcus sp. PCC 7502 TaxID=1173263 RepID=UPI00029F81C4|nr:prepilin-type N-terminal cleavage/methylation domain-containing protein [Synechococcus sp. PCC 7502]AFY74745.1 prepilin-type N-terminal cleavage/methylation domain-containing protein [Synechococcus sp. PCC 7502]
MNTTEPIKYRGYTYWIAGTEGKFFGYIEAVPKMINRSEQTFGNIEAAESFLIGQIDLACGDAIKYVGDRGYTLLEILVVMTMIGILSAIAAPGWIGFLNNQSVRSANGKVYSAIAQAKSEAKLNKVTKIVEFRQNGINAEYAVYTSGDTPIWQTLSDDVTVSAIAIPINYQGTINPNNVPSQVTITKGNLKRCTSIVTLLGAVRQGEGTECP